MIFTAELYDVDNCCVLGNSPYFRILTLFDNEDVRVFALGLSRFLLDLVYVMHQTRKKKTNLDSEQPLYFNKLGL